MKQRFSEKRIPTVFALLLLVLGIGVSTFLVREGIFTVSTAAPDYTPDNVIVSNISDRSFTVSFVTQDPTIGGVRIENTGTVFFDDRSRDLPEKSRYTSHYVTVNGLTPDTDYRFSLVSDNQFWGEGEYTAQTGPEIKEAALNQASARGTINDGSSGLGSIIVSFSVEGFQTLSTITDEDGSYEFALEQLRSSGLDSYKLLREDSVLTLGAYRGNVQSSIKVYYKDSQPVQPIIFGENYDFLTSNVSTLDASPGAQLLLPTGTIVRSSLTVTSPAENQTFIDSTPTFRGTAPANSEVSIRVDEGSPFSAFANSSGFWSYEYEQQLAQGKHRLVVRVGDSIGVQQQKTIDFEIFPSGSIVTQSATPSATPTDVPSTPTPTATPPDPETSPTLTPTLTPTPLPTAKPSASPTPTITPFLTITPTSPGSGGVVAVSIVSFILLLGGASLFLFL